MKAVSRAMSLAAAIALANAAFARDPCADGPCFDPASPPLAPLDAGRYRLDAGVAFGDAAGRRWVARSGTVTDGASIPGVFVGLIGSRTDERFLPAAIVHDAYCARDNAHLPSYRAAPWETVHRMFLDGLLAGGTPRARALVMYAAVYLGGPRWDDPERDLSDVPPETLRGVLERCIEFIRAEDPSADELDGWMRDNESGEAS